ncbi:hypothetical protein CH63R_12919 [Colletotrichum higginsianum IMI 349063]|uniref:Uncharacterized protein n=1 Tax=Colletotrichum higginsianum (strain IMI 349063) TaxID=759273 RepID=A0A1B7XVH9_COLHI|nr:hypothetical protein CH63R_12919 [Colletotrichum higginsianum IMI 349063]OBR03792.1 hypothetical protein CH63R_12919 [Colletotrichum higginsianum IMI 349063]
MPPIKSRHRLWIRCGGETSTEEPVALPSGNRLSPSPPTFKLLAVTTVKRAPVAYGFQPVATSSADSGRLPVHSSSMLIIDGLLGWA